MPTGVYKRTKKQLEQIRSLAKDRIGKPLPQKTRDKIKLHYSPNSLKTLLEHNRSKKNKTYIEIYGREGAREIKEKLRKKHLGKTLSKNHRKKLSEAHKGKKPKNFEKILTKFLFKQGKGNPNWIDGRTNNKEFRKKYFREYIRERAKRDPKFHLDQNIGNFIYQSLKSKKAGRKWEGLVGYTLDKLILHLESQFDDNMNWDNYGPYWWIDHIKPRSLFKYSLAEDPKFKKCWALKNLQPMEKKANLRKSNKYQTDIPNHEEKSIITTEI